MVSGTSFISKKRTRTLKKISPKNTLWIRDPEKNSSRIHIQGVKSTGAYFTTSTKCSLVHNKKRGTYL
jgi:hypothetical protein